MSRGLTQSLLGRPICSLAPHISLIKTVYRAPSNQVSTVYLSEPMVVTSYTAGEGSVSMVLSVTRFGTIFASFSSVAAFAWSQNALPLIGRCPRSDKGKAPVFSRRLTLCFRTFTPPAHSLSLTSRLWIHLPLPTSKRRINQLFIVIELLRLLVPVTTLGHLGGPPWCSHESRHICLFHVWFPWCSSSIPHQGHRQTH